MKTLNDYVDEEDARNPGFRQRVDAELAAMNAEQFEFDYVWPEPKRVARMVAVRVERWDELNARIAALEAALLRCYEWVAMLPQTHDGSNEIVRTIDTALGGKSHDAFGLEAERDAARAEAARLRDLLQDIVPLLQQQDTLYGHCERVLTRLYAALAGGGEQQP